MANSEVKGTNKSLCQMCARCKKELPFTNFTAGEKNFKSCQSCRDYCKNAGKRSSKVCPSCDTDKLIDQFEKQHKVCKSCDLLTERQRPNTKRHKLLQFYINLKKSGICVDCKCSDWTVLEFDHLRDKVNEVRRMTTEKSMRQEAAKCEFRCCNCHMIKTFENTTRNPVIEGEEERNTIRARNHTRKRKQEVGCLDCGCADPRCLQFDHIGEKKYNIKILTSNGASTKKLDEEIEKCVVRCGNCHRKKTNIQFNYLSYPSIDYS